MISLVAGRALSLLAAAALLVVVVLNVLPNPVTSYDDGNVGRRLECGSFLFPTDHSFTDVCEDRRIGRVKTSFVLWVASLPLSVAGLVLIYRDVRHR